MSELPSPARLRRASVIAVVVAVVLVVVVVLPAERAVDITGVGNVLGLTEMGMIKVQFKAELAAEAANKAAKATADSIIAAEKAAVLAAVASGTRPDRTDTISVTVKPGDEMPILLQMRKQAWVIYTWTGTGGVVDYDIRGDSVGAEDWWYHRYESGNAVASHDGVLVANFNGRHGWYWKNNGDMPVTITIIARGTYTTIAK